MSLELMIDEIKGRRGFFEQAGTILAHNATVRNRSLADGKKIAAVELVADELKLGALCQEFGSRDGIFAITAQAGQGRLQPGEDLLLLVVAGDTPQHVLPVFTELLARIEADAIGMREISAD